MYCYNSQVKAVNRKKWNLRSEMVYIYNEQTS